ncbi:MAG: NUDIX hydrolase [Deltaproteobacteria bacterium]|nr:NUDIX hydrolase [Deltaproteobacteria bacterium]
MKYRILNKKKIFGEFFHINKIELLIERFHEKDQIEIKRYHLERPEVVAVILENHQTGDIVMVEQFRYSSIKKTQNNGWMLEIIGGIVDKGETPEECAKRECLEETGYEIENPVLLTSYFASAGFSNELLHLYYAKISPKNKIAPGGGVREENEDILVREIPFNKLLESVRTGELTDSKTIIALQWLALEKTNDKAGLTN